MNIPVLKKIGCVIKINNTGKGQCRGLKTKMIENQEITTCKDWTALGLHCIYTAISNDDLKLKSIQLPKRAKI